MENQIPRRCRIDLMTPVELAITEAMIAVENAGASPQLTMIGAALMKAREQMSDIVDGVEPDVVNSASDNRRANNVMRHNTRVLTDREKHLMETVKDWGMEMLDLCSTIVSNNPSAARETSLAITKTEEAVMWAIKGLTK